MWRALGRLVFDFLFNPAIGITGGILCIWNKESLEVTNLIMGNGIILVEGIWKEERCGVVIANVHSPCD